MNTTKNYKHIFWDLDHTLWDFEKNADITLRLLFAQHSLAEVLQTNPDRFCELFSKNNHELWVLYNSSQINKNELRKLRFPRLFKRFGVSEKFVPPSIEDEYQTICRQQPHLMPNARLVLKTLQERGYQMHIISNGFQDAQAEKLVCANLDTFFQVLVTSESCSYRKPQKGIFLHTFQKCAAKAQESIMIGDNLSTDIAGANAVQMHNVWYNPNKEVNSSAEKPTFQIHDLAELLDICI